MKLIQKLVNERFASSAARFLKIACYFVMAFFLLCLVLSCMGRQTFILHASTGTYDRAIYAEEDHSPRSRSLTVSMPDEVHIQTMGGDQVSLATQIGLSLMFAVNMVPLFFAYWFLSRVFANVHEGQIFTEQNAVYLLYYGLLQFFTALLAPFLKLLICHLANRFSVSQISIATGQGMFSTLVPSVAFLVAAYIIHYGIHLQDEVDHTL